MENRNEEAIIKNLVVLSKELTLEPFLSLLMQENVFTDVDFQYIQAEKTPFDKNRKICLDVKRKGPEAFRKFVSALYESDQDRLGDLLLLTEYNLRNNTSLESYDDIPSEACMEAEGCFPKRKKKSSTTRKGQPVTQPSEETPNAPPPPPAEGQPDPPQNGACGGGEPFESDRYRQESDPRGYMLIINNKNFQHLPDRSGTDVDMTTLESTFTAFGFEVEVEHSLTSQAMKEKLAAFSQKPEHKNVDSSIVAILTHGQEGAVCGTDSTETERLVLVKDIEDQFNGKNCSHLINKPKLFIMQTCRGDKEDAGVFEADGDPDEKYSEMLKRRRRMQCSPTNADIIFAFATVNEHKAYRNTVHGSPYIQRLCSIFRQNYAEKHVADMLTLVTNAISQEDMGNVGDLDTKKMLPQKADTLRKFWYMNPKFPLSPSSH